MVAGWHRIGIMRRNESACLLTDLLFLWVSIIKLKLNVLVWYKTHILTNSPKTTCSRHDKVEKCSLGLNCNHSLTLKIFLIENDYYSVEFSSWIYLNTASITLNNNQSINQSIKICMTILYICFILELKDWTITALYFDKTLF